MKNELQNGRVSIRRFQPDDAAALHAPWQSLAIALGFWLAFCVPWSRAASTNEPVKPNHPCRYTNEVVAEIPWSIHIVEFERGRRDFELCTTLGKGNVIGMGTVSEQIKSLPRACGEPLAAVNGDFYEKSEKHEGRPRDLQIRFGEVTSSPAGHTCFWVAPDGTPQMTNVFSRFRVIWPNGKTTPIGLNQLRDDDSAVLYTSVFGPSTRTAVGMELVLERGTNTDWLPLKVGRQYAGRVRAVRKAGNTALTPEIMVLSLGLGLAEEVPAIEPGATVRIVTETVPDLTGVNVAIGGGPALVRDGKPLQWTGFFKLRHPRTALGWNKKHYFLVVVDGREADVSIGMTLPELANYMAKIGCEQAMNLDGGGSATLWAFGVVRNSPSEGEERSAPNALVLVKKAVRKP
ncbi:MAG: phosphodiester glycosidase family protein [Limisphaerales bacterium]